jgi:AcrR family transcriptional regulator
MPQAPRPGSETPAETARALDQARPRRVIKPADQRHKEILQAAAKLFHESGFSATSVPRIAREAGVAAGTVYIYFPSKEAILLELQEDFNRGLLDRFTEIAQQVLAEEDAAGEIVGYQEVVERLVDGMVAYALERRIETEVLAREVGRMTVAPRGPLLMGGLTELLARVIREGVRLGYIHVSHPEMAAYLLNQAAMTAIGQVIAFEDEKMLAQVVQQAKELYIKTLAPLS